MKEISYDHPSTQWIIEMTIKINNLMNTLLLYLLNFGAIVSGILVITCRNPILSVLCLIAVFVNVACYLVLLGMSFLGLMALHLYSKCLIPFYTEIFDDVAELPGRRVLRG